MNTDSFLKGFARGLEKMAVDYAALGHPEMSYRSLQPSPAPAASSMPAPAPKPKAAPTNTMLMRRAAAAKGGGIPQPKGYK